MATNSVLFLHPRDEPMLAETGDNIVAMPPGKKRLFKSRNMLAEGS